MDFLGPKLLGTNEVEGDRASMLSGKQYVLLYFSASWCPPCKAFTPQLADFYTRFAKEKNFEIVLMSGDNSEGDMLGYFKTMPWLALPYRERELKSTLSTKYQVKSIPTLITLDAKTGEVVCTNARNMIVQDSEGSGWPWKAADKVEAATIRTGNSDLGSVFVKRDGTKVGRTVLEGKHIMLYFSAHWCPPCRKFTPMLKNFWEEYTAKSDDLIIIYVSSDRDQNEFDDYFAQHGAYYALPFEESSRRKELQSFYGVKGIPATVLLSPTDRTILHRDCRRIVTNGAAEILRNGWSGTRKESSCCTIC